MLDFEKLHELFSDFHQENKKKSHKLQNLVRDT